MSAATTKKKIDAVVIGADIDGLVAATTLAKSGKKVLLVEEGEAPGGTLREIEFAPGYRAAPLAPATDRALIGLNEGAPIVLQDSIVTTIESLLAHSEKDAARWHPFVLRTQALAGFLAELYRKPPPRIDADSFGEALALFGLGREYRKLGRGGMSDLLRMLPMPIADLLDDEFETPALKGVLAAFAVTDLAQGPAAAGTAFAFLHRQLALNAFALDRPAEHIESEVLRARKAGVTIELKSRMRAVTVRDGCVAGVVLDSGVEHACNTVISSLDPHRSLLELIDPKYLDPDFIHAVRNIRFRGVTTKVLIALDTLPAVPYLPAPPGASAGPVAGSLLIAPSIRHIERAYEVSKYGRCSENPFIEIRFPTLLQPEFAPTGKHVAVLHVQYTPHRLREDTWGELRDVIADRAIAQVERHLPGFAARVRDRKVLAPPDLEARFGVREGAASQGEMALDQILFMRPVPTASRYATPIEGYYLCGAGTHPGAGVHGVSGELAAQAAIKRPTRRKAARVGS